MTDTNYDKYFIKTNVYKIIQEAYDERFERGEDVLGCSDLPFCARGLIIYRLFFPGDFRGNMKMLHGKIHHEVIQNKKVLIPLLKSICDELNFDPYKLKYKIEKKFRIEIMPQKFIEGHIDIYTNFFIVEIKTTDMPLSYYGDKVAPFHFIQTNMYLGSSETRIPNGKDDERLGYLLSLNLRAYRADLEDIDDVWRQYGHLIPVLYSQKIYDKTIERAQIIFKMIERKKFNLAGPEYDWECKTCDPKIKKICGRE